DTVTGLAGGHGRAEEGFTLCDRSVVGCHGACAGRQAGGDTLAFDLLLGEAEVGAGNGAAGHQDGPRRPALVVDATYPVHEGDHVADFLVAHAQVRHESPVLLLVVELRRVFHEGGEVGRAPQLGDLGEIGRVVGAFAENGVAVDAVVVVPDVLAAHDFFGDGVGVGEGGELAVAVDGEDQEEQACQGRRHDGKQPGLTFVHHVLLHADASPVANGRDHCVGDAQEHQRNDDPTYTF